MAERIVVYYTKVWGVAPAWHKTLVYIRNDSAMSTI